MSIWTEVENVNLSHVSDADILKLAKQAQKAVNQRLNRLESAGLASKVTTGGIKPASARSITTRKQAIRAINRARSLGGNPLSTPGKVHQAVKEAAKRFDVPEHMIKIGVGQGGQPMTTVKGMPFDRPLKQTVLSDEENIRRFWHWLEEGAGKGKYTSDDVYKLVDEAVEQGVNAISYVKRAMAIEERQRMEEERVLERETLHPESSQFI